MSIASSQALDRAGEERVELLQRGDGAQALLAVLAALGAADFGCGGDLVDASGQRLEAVGVQELEQGRRVERLAAQLVEAER